MELKCRLVAIAMHRPALHWRSPQSDQSFAKLHACLPKLLSTKVLSGQPRGIPSRGNALMHHIILIEMEKQFRENVYNGTP
jgi:hypothetical protein